MQLASLAYSKIALKHASAPWAVLTSITGFMSDVLKPEQNLAPYFLLASVLGLAICFFFFRKRVKQEGVEHAFNSTLGGFLAFFALSIFGWLILTYLFSLTPPQGLAAAKIPVIADFQKEVFHIQSVLEDTQQSLDRLESRVLELQSKGLIITNPKEAAAFYSNARLYEVKGRDALALRSYAEFLKKMPNFYDVHQAYLRLAKDLQSVEETNNFYAQLSLQHPQNPMIQLIQIERRTSADQLKTKLEKFVEEQQKVGPAQLKLALMKSDEILLESSFSSMEQSKQELEKLKSLDQKGFLKPYYLDKNDLKAAQQKIETLQHLFDEVYNNVLENPLRFDIKQDDKNPGWVNIGWLNLDDQVKTNYYAFDKLSEWQETGLIDVDGKTISKSSIQKQLPAGKHKIYVKYVKKNGTESRVFEQEFELKDLFLNFKISPKYDLRQREILYQIVWAKINPKIVSYLYSVDQDSLNQNLSDTDYQKNQPLEVTLPPGDHVIYYQGVLEDGSKTAVYQKKISPY